MQKEKESHQEAEKECPQKEAKQDHQLKTSNKQKKRLSDLLKSVGDCV
jgi:hypothetical protein